MKYTLIALILYLYFTVCTAMTTLSIHLQQHQLTVEVPTTAQEFKHGLMKRHYLSSHHGMLFLFDTHDAKPVAMWMKNTALSLDMIFFDEQRRIVCVIPHTTPFSLTPISCPPHNISAVLELKAGSARKLHLKIYTLLKISKGNFNEGHAACTH